MERVIIKNKKAMFDYEIGFTVVAGLVLKGSEVKGIKASKVSIGEAFITVSPSGKQLILKGANITIPEYAVQEKVNPTRDRVLLVSKAQRDRLKKGVEREGYTIVPIAITIADNGLVKIHIALAKGRKTYDKREVLKKRDIERNEKLKF